VEGKGLLGSEQKHDEDSYEDEDEEDKQEFMKQDSSVEEEVKRLKSELRSKSDPEDSEYSEEDEDNLSVHDNDSFPYWYKRRDSSMYTNKAWKGSSGSNS